MILQCDIEIKRLVALQEPQADEGVPARLLVLQPQHKVSGGIDHRLDRGPRLVIIALREQGACVFASYKYAVRRETPT